MKISNSSIAMESQRTYQEMVVSKSVSIMSHVGSKVNFEDDGGGFFDQLSKAKEQRSLESQMEELKAGTTISRPSYNADGTKCVTSIRELKNLVLEQLLSRLEGKRAAYTGCLKNMSGYFSNANAKAVVQNTGEYVVQTVQSEFYMEEEVTKFSTTGTVTLEDGTEYNINFSVEMTRSYMESMEIYTEESVVLCDPLVINFNGDTTRLSDQKFCFDLDCDGKEDEISYFSSNSGFLALDNNDDGVINDGSELFGTKSGDGFKDLARFDLDQNGWIDENDDIFERLKVWTKDENGNNILMNLKDSGVGAIYLGVMDTALSLNNLWDNSVNGVIQKSGICLMENGDMNTVMHVDFAV